MSTTKGKDALYISVDGARALAISGAEFDIGDFTPLRGQDLLEKEFLEAEHAWMFFQNQRIEVPEKNSLNRGAYAVSKRGHIRFIADYFDNPVEARDYLQVMSKYFADNNL